MSKGFLVIAQNNNKYDYVKMAYALALSIKNTQIEHNSFSIAITEGTEIKEEYKKVFDNILTIPWSDSALCSSWKVENKWKYYYITPYDETIILDTDMIFTSDISTWWYLFENYSVVSASQVRNFRNEPIKDVYYRKTFINNNLPNVYTAFLYFKKNKEAGRLFRTLNYVFKNWNYFYDLYCKKDKPTTFSADVAYAIAIKLLGKEDEYLLKNPIPTFVHMKGKIIHKDLNDNWMTTVPTYYNNDLNLIVGGYNVFLPFHYHIKEWLTDDIIKKLENKFYEKR